MSDKKYSDEIYELMGRVSARESDLEIFQKFAKDGGQYRISISVDHPDHHVKRVVEAIAASCLPRERMMEGFGLRAERDLKKSKEALQAFVMADALTAEVQP